MKHTAHENHTHIHGANCGHPAVHHGDHYDEHVIEVSAKNPAVCSPTACDCGHNGCSHATAPHGDHFDYVSNGRLHHRHGDHCDDHGPVA